MRKNVHYILRVADCLAISFLMNKAELIREITATYEKHGWRLRRVLLSEDLRPNLSDFAGAEFEISDLDALWFSRPSINNREAWELRAISPMPFALFESFDEKTPEEERAEMRREMENRLRRRQAKT